MTADGAVVAGRRAVARRPAVLHVALAKNQQKDSVMTDEEARSGQDLDHAAGLLEQEFRKANAEATESADETTVSLRKDATNLLDERVANPARYSEDPSRACDWFLKATSLLALYRMLTRPAGFRLDAVEEPGPRLRLHLPANGHSPEGFELRLLDVKGLAPVPGNVSVADSPSDMAGEASPERHYHHAACLLMQQVQNGNAAARIRRGLRSDVTSYRLEVHARGMLEDMATDPNKYNHAPFQTKGRLLRFVAHLAADRMLSHTGGIRHEVLAGHESCIRIHLPEDRHPPESLELRLQPLN